MLFSVIKKLSENVKMAEAFELFPTNDRNVKRKEKPSTRVSYSVLSDNLLGAASSD